MGQSASASVRSVQPDHPVQPVQFRRRQLKPVRKPTVYEATAQYLFWERTRDGQAAVIGRAANCPTLPGSATLATLANARRIDEAAGRASTHPVGGLHRPSAR